MKLFIVIIKTYNFGIYRYPLFVHADCEESARKCVIDYPKFHHDEDAEIESVNEIDLSGTANKVINLGEYD